MLGVLIVADIAMCKKADCPSFKECYRAQEITNDNGKHEEFDNDGESCCDDYIPIKPVFINQPPR